jgi:hypothetical protein
MPGSLTGLLAPTLPSIGRRTALIEIRYRMSMRDRRPAIIGPQTKMPDRFGSSSTI